MGLFSSRRRAAITGAVITSSRNRQRATASQQPAVPANTTDTIEQIKQLAELKDQGILTQAEFDAKKKQLLGI